MENLAPKVTYLRGFFVRVWKSGIGCTIENEDCQDTWVMKELIINYSVTFVGAAAIATTFFRYELNFYAELLLNYFN